MTHIIAQDTESFQYKARLDKRDMIDVRWLLECAEQRRLVPLRPRHYLHLTRATMDSCPDMDPYGDMSAARPRPNALSIHFHMQQLPMHLQQT